MASRFNINLPLPAISTTGSVLDPQERANELSKVTYSFNSFLWSYLKFMFQTSICVYPHNFVPLPSLHVFLLILLFIESLFYSSVYSFVYILFLQFSVDSRSLPKVSELFTDFKSLEDAARKNKVRKFFLIFPSPVFTSLFSLLFFVLCFSQKLQKNAKIVK